MSLSLTMTVLWLMRGATERVCTRAPHAPTRALAGRRASLSTRATPTSCSRRRTRRPFVPLDDELLISVRVGAADEARRVVAALAFGRQPRRSSSSNSSSPCRLVAPRCSPSTPVNCAATAAAAAATAELRRCRDATRRRLGVQGVHVRQRVCSNYCSTCRTAWRTSRWRARDGAPASFLYRTAS